MRLRLKPRDWRQMSVGESFDVVDMPDAGVRYHNRFPSRIDCRHIRVGGQPGERRSRYQLHPIEIGLGKITPRHEIQRTVDPGRKLEFHGHAL